MHRANFRHALIFSIIFSACGIGESWAFSGTEGASFLNIPIGGRPAALGGAYSALANDAFAPVYNPAGMALAPSNQFAAMHLSFVNSINYEFASLVVPLGKGRGLGASIQYFRPGEISGTDENGNPTGNFSGSYGAYSIGYGQALGKFAIGAVGKNIQGKIAGFSASSFAADLGLMFMPTHSVGLGLVAANLGSNLKFQNEGDPLPASYKMGGFYRANSQWLLALQGTRQNTGVSSLQSGIEWSPVNILSLRAGYRTENSRELSTSGSWTAGVGLQLAGQQFDYAWVPMSDLGNTQYFSMVFQWGAKKNDDEY